MVVIFLFLASFRSVIIPVVTIPLSLVGVCSLMLMMGFSINLLTLLAMVLAIGLWSTTQSSWWKIFIAIWRRANRLSRLRCRARAKSWAQLFR